MELRFSEFLSTAPTRINDAAGSVVRWIKLSRVRHARHRGCEVVIKRRNAFGKVIIPVANGFFRVAHAAIGFCPNTRAWQSWELGCFHMLNPEFRAWPAGADGVVEEKLPGKNLMMHVREGTLNTRMLKAAGQELRRAHGQWSDAYQGPWSHGDAAMCNYLYDPKTHRARLIDFEIMHDRQLSPAERHAEDLLSFLLDLTGMVSERRVLPYARCFLRAYGSSEAMAELHRRLIIPRGVAGLWWKVRANFVDTARMRGRLEKLRRAMDFEAVTSDPEMAFPLVHGASRDGALPATAMR